jgi:hypothetical protein
MATSSAAAGFLAPVSAPTYDVALEDTFHPAIVGITGIPGNLVRPRWQPEPPQQPAFNVDWCAFGITVISADEHPYEVQGMDVLSMERDELINTLISFYGPNSSSNCARFRDGLSLSQNRDTLRAAGITVMEVGDATILPALLKETWVKRVDTRVIYRRRSIRTFPVLPLLSGELGLDNESYVTPIQVNNP